MEFNVSITANVLIFSTPFCIYYSFSRFLKLKSSSHLAWHTSIILFTILHLSILAFIHFKYNKHNGWVSKFFLLNITLLACLCICSSCCILEFINIRIYLLITFMMKLWRKGGRKKYFKISDSLLHCYIKRAHQRPPFF